MQANCLTAMAGITSSAGGQLTSYYRYWGKANFRARGLLPATQESARRQQLEIPLDAWLKAVTGHHGIPPQSDETRLDKDFSADDLAPIDLLPASCAATPLQAIIGAQKISSIPHLFVLEDVTGAGKTEAALKARCIRHTTVARQAWSLVAVKLYPATKPRHEEVVGTKCESRVSKEFFTNRRIKKRILY